MGRKRKRVVPDSQERIFCYYCDRTFQNEHELLSHQREKHLRCPTCNKRMLSVPSLMIHASQMHNVQLKAVPNAISGRDSPHLQVLGMENIPDDYYSRHQKGQGHTQPARSTNTKPNHNGNNSHSNSTNSTNYSKSSVPPLTAVNPHYPPAPHAHHHHQQQQPVPPHVPPQYPHPQYPPTPHPPPSLPGNQTYPYPTPAPHLHHHQTYAAYHHQNSYPHVALMPQPTYQHHPHMDHPTWYPNGHPYYPNAHGASTYHRPLPASSAPGGHRAPASVPVPALPPAPSSTSSANPTPAATAAAVSSATTTPASVSLPSEPLSTSRQPTDAAVTSKDGNQTSEKSATAPDKQDGATSDSTVPVRPQRPPDNCIIVFDSIDMSPEENRAKLSRYQLKAAT